MYVTPQQENQQKAYLCLLAQSFEFKSWAMILDKKFFHINKTISLLKKAQNELKVQLNLVKKSLFTEDLQS